MLETISSILTTSDSCLDVVSLKLLISLNLNCGCYRRFLCSFQPMFDHLCLLHTLLSSRIRTGNSLLHRYLCHPSGMQAHPSGISLLPQGYRLCTMQKLSYYIYFFPSLCFIMVSHIGISLVVGILCFSFLWVFSSVWTTFALIICRLAGGGLVVLSLMVRSCRLSWTTLVTIISLMVGSILQVLFL